MNKQSYASNTKCVKNSNPVRVATLRHSLRVYNKVWGRGVFKWFGFWDLRLVWVKLFENFITYVDVIFIYDLVRPLVVVNIHSPEIQAESKSSQKLFSMCPLSALES